MHNMGENKTATFFINWNKIYLHDHKGRVSDRDRIK